MAQRKDGQMCCALGLTDDQQSMVFWLPWTIRGTSQSLINFVYLQQTHHLQQIIRCGCSAMKRLTSTDSLVIDKCFQHFHVIALFYMLYMTTVLGNPRGNENAFLLSFGIVLFRWHNLIATYLHQSRPKWGGERIFQVLQKSLQKFRKTVAAEQILFSVSGSKKVGNWNVSKHRGI